jgi:Domain of unknown function (DUF4388)
MALTGHLSDLSLSELIEFFCNQRKSGRIEVLYPQGVGFFYLKDGSVVDAQIGVARGIDAVFYALTLPNAKFEFNGAEEAPEKTITQPWTQVVLEGLRRLDEGIQPVEAFPEDFIAERTKAENIAFEEAERNRQNTPAFLSSGKESLTKRKTLVAAMVVAAVLVIVAALGVPAGWYSRNKVEAEPQAVVTPAPEPVAAALPSPAEASGTPETASSNEDAAAAAARRQRDKERAKARDERPTPNTASSTTVNPPAGPKRITVTVTYDESGRVTQASGGDASAIRIARQKRFPPGKAGSATVSIPIN